MPFKKNYEREKKLLSFWYLGHTVRDTASLTGIPAGTISHYFARFNKNKNEFRERAISNQEPPRSSTHEVIGAALMLSNVDQKVTELMDNEEYAKARNYLQAVSLHLDFRKKYGAIIGNADPEKWGEIGLELAKFHVMRSEIERMQTIRTNDRSKTINSTINKEDLKDPNVPLKKTIRETIIEKILTDPFVNSEAIHNMLKEMDLTNPKVSSEEMRNIVKEMDLTDPKVRSEAIREIIKEMDLNRVKEDT